MNRTKTMSLEKYIEIFQFENGRDPEFDEAMYFFKWTDRELWNQIQDSSKIVHYGHFDNGGGKFKIYLDRIKEDA